MPKITFIQPGGEEQNVEAPENWSVMQIATANGIKGIEGVCGGSMACATCHVYIHPDWQDRVNASENEKTEEEEDTLDTAFHVRKNSRLGCQIKISNDLDGLIVILPSAG